MKKLAMTMSIILISLLGYSQVTSVGEFRVADAVTAFGINLPVGTKVYDIANNKYYVATAGVPATATITTGAASFSLLNDAGTDDQTAAEVAATAAGNLESTNVQAALQELQGDMDVNTGAISTNAASIAANSANIATNATNIATNAADIAANASAIATNAAAIAAIETNVPTQLSTGTVDGTSYGITSDGGTDDLVLAAATTTAAGVMTAAQVTKLDGIETGAQVNYTWITATFSESSATPTAHPLTNAVADGCTVSINGAVLPQGKYTLTTSSLTLNVPVLQYDQVVVTYRSSGAI